MGYCTKCGKENPDTARFCTACGASLYYVPGLAKPPFNRKILFVAGIIALIIIVATVYSLFNNKTSSVVGKKNATKDTLVTIPPFIPQSLYSVPPELLYTGKNKKDEDLGTLYSKFFPIGWSEDGKFAYVEEPVDEACGCYFFNIYIQNMYSDKMAWQWKFEGEEGDGMNLEKIWKKFGSMFTDKLNVYQISPLSFSKLEKLPLMINNNECSFSVNNTPLFDNDSKETTIGATNVTMKINGVVKKKLFSAKYSYQVPEVSSATYSKTFSNKILGYLKNPYENRIALFYMVERAGWEGPPSVIEFNLIGCDLNIEGLNYLNR